MAEPSGVFQPDFLIAIRALINVHHSIYPKVPPQGIYFEALVEEAFRWIKKPFTVVRGTGRNLAGHDLVVEDKKISLKTETGAGTDAQRISITKLCTTEREPWTPDDLIARVLSHLGRYDIILMLRAVWDKPMIRYQLLEVPVATLRLLGRTKVIAVGKRAGRRSLGADVLSGDQVMFHVHFDASDGKCSIRNFPVENCVRLLDWELLVPEDHSHLSDLRKTSQ